MLELLCDQVFVITGNFEGQYGDRVHIDLVERGRARPRRISVAMQIVAQLSAQIKLTIRLSKIHRSLDLVLFDIGEFRNLMPLLLAKLLRKRTLVVHLGGNKLLEYQFEFHSGWEKIIPALLGVMLRVCYRLVDNILCISDSIVEFGGLTEYRKKILIYGGEHIDTVRFAAGLAPGERAALIGYAGRHSPKKGIMNLIRAVPLALKERPDARFLIAGSGEQSDAILKEVRNMGLEQEVTLVPWIADAEYPSFLNRLKLFVLPSYEEGLPVTMKEAMACGAVVLATAVGGIPDLIKNGKTGFILADNSPACIAQTILKALSSPYLDRIARDARSLIEKEASFVASLEKWRYVLESVLGRNVSPRGNRPTALRP